MAGILDAALIEQLSSAISTLNPDQKEILHLRFAGELTYRQIGTVLGKSESAAKMAVRRLLDKLADLMEADHE